jgi:hypothetical protein
MAIYFLNAIEQKNYIYILHTLQKPGLKKKSTVKNVRPSVLTFGTNRLKNEILVGASHRRACGSHL